MDVKNNFDKGLKIELPPIWPDIETELTEYIECLDNLPIYHVDKAQSFWSREPDILSLLDVDQTPVGTTLKFDSDPVNRKLSKIHEVAVKAIGETAQNSMSMTRAPDPANNYVRGSNNMIFWPGGFDEPKMTVNTSMENIDFEKNLKTLAKGFSAGIEFERDNCTPKERRVDEEEPSNLGTSDIEIIADKINLMSIVNEERNELDLWMPEITEVKEENKTKSSLVQESLFDEIAPILETTLAPVLNISKYSSEIEIVHTSKTYCTEINPYYIVGDIKKLIPDIAMSFPYELDNFQKQAILKLEEGCNVFVAAHTSTGKTTVAEYAIALSQKHMTRVIYTSPTKALSNQKYRDFRKKFDSVGLLTGDIQINPKASCLIMTIEILQSMLYNASEVLRDLEFVIFDEVHYINDNERGHVWEEIVILLPQSTTLVMLSATVPNPLEFADWVGHIKEKIVYVIVTKERPVPLNHYLYTGKSDNYSLIVNHKNKFLLSGWQAVQKEKVEEKIMVKGQSKKKDDSSMWNSLINTLQTKKMLPVVIFMLSRKRCDTTSLLLRRISLTTLFEKAFIRKFFQSNIKHLKGTDRQLPQVILMQELLERGIGIHHSGILPILKEIVEILFQYGKVKVLFATETFAIGINMPARTVVFSAIKKFDGTNFRILHPTEYTQMAGRAGRRGHDVTGTVIVMCPKDLPHFTELKNMMCGKAQNLESKFKITYSMVLNLRRLNESVTVETMMKHSFKELQDILNRDSYKHELMKIQENLENLPPLTDLQKKLSDFYRIAIEYIDHLKYIKPRIYSTHKKAVKSLTPGRVLLISYKWHYNKLALLLEINQTETSKMYKVFVLNTKEQKSSSLFSNNQEARDRWFDMIALTKKEIFVPVKDVSYEILTIAAWNILEITNRRIEEDCSQIMYVCENTRHWIDPKVSKVRDLVIEALMSMSLEVSHNSSQTFMEISDMKKKRLLQLKQNVYDTKCTEISNFEEKFEIVFKRIELETERNKLQWKLSNEGLILYPEYTNATELLKELGYIDRGEGVTLKGRVALQMANNELLITELILKNVLTVLQPAEIVSLLSTLVFQQKTDVKPNLTEELKRNYEVLKEIHNELDILEQHYQLSMLQPLNIGLMEVVYDWAQAKSFAEIMKKTDVQEGIIVRCIQKLSEMLRDVKNAAFTIGDPVLRAKMEEASVAIKRDIVFTASLYTLD